MNDRILHQKTLAENIKMQKAQDARRRQIRLLRADLIAMLKGGRK